MPPGLTLDGTTGQITGTVASAGAYAATVHASNAVGSDDGPLVINVGSQLALTPPAGWNSYDSYGDTVTEAQVMANAQAVQSTLQPTGWDTVVVDFRWYDPQAANINPALVKSTLTMDANGRLQPAVNRFPSAANGAGFKALAANVHALGLRFGIHIMRGIPRQAVNANTPIAGSAYYAKDAADTSSTCAWSVDMYGVRDTPAGQAWWDSIVSQYAEWGVDFVKCDDMVEIFSPNLYHQSEVHQLRAAINKVSRSIVLSLSPGETPISASADLQLNANMWRVSSDFWDSWSSLSHSFDLGVVWEGVSGPVHWPDADMLPVGSLSPACPIGGADRVTKFTQNEQVTMVSLWAVLPSPMMLGANATKLDAWTTALLTNEEVMAIDQDSLGSRARMLVKGGGGSNTTEVWGRNLSGGGKAVGLFNLGSADTTVSATFGQIGVSGDQIVRDVWRRADLPVAKTNVSASVPGHGAVLLRLTPAALAVADSGAGMSDESGGIFGQADASTAAEFDASTGVGGPFASGSTSGASGGSAASTVGNASTGMAHQSGGGTEAASGTATNGVGASGGGISGAMGAPADAAGAGEVAESRSSGAGCSAGALESNRSTTAIPGIAAWLFGIAWWRLRVVRKRVVDRPRRTQTALRWRAVRANSASEISRRRRTDAVPSIESVFVYSYRMMSRIE